MAEAALKLDGLDPAVVAAYLAAPETQNAEIIDGQLYLQARPARPHTRCASRLAMVVGSPFDLGIGGPGGWVILFEPELWFGRRPDILAPDLAGWRRERLPNALVDDAGEAHYETAPDWVCEVLSPSTEAIDRVKKKRIYKREGVSHLWLLSPTLQTLEVYRLRDGVWFEVDTFEGDAVVRAEPFDALELPLAQLWES